MISKNNNFNFLRLLFATAVVYSHAFALLGFQEPTLFNRSVGNLSVHAFFAISGYLICQSYLRGQGDGTLFFINRILRIAPGLIVAMLFTYYVALLCGGFVNNPVKYITNGTVWTLTWEVVCYIGLFVIGYIGLLSNGHFRSFFAAAWMLFLVNIHNVGEVYLVIAPLVMMFLSGMFYAISTDIGAQKKFPWMAVFGLLLVFNYDSFAVLHKTIASHIPFLWGPSINPEQVARVIYLLAFPSLVIYIGRLHNDRFQIKNDISYGVYIYGWPVAQAIVYLASQRNVELQPLSYFVLTMVAVVPLSILSWLLIEKPFMAFRILFFQKADGKKSTE